jgi:predicted transcriptional regulator
MEIINMLRDDCLKLTDLRKKMRDNGIRIPISTVYRAINNLNSAGVIEKKNGEIFLTPAGIFFSDAINSLKRLMGFEYLELATDFLLSLPPELRFGIHHLSECEKVDFIRARELSTEVLSSIREGGIYIDRVVDPELFHLMIEKRLDGAVEKVISGEEVLFQKIEAEISALKMINLEKDVIREIEERVEVRVKTLPLQMGVIDRRIGVIMLIQGNHFSPFFVTKERGAIRWLESVFNYYWDIAKPLEDYIEGGKDGLIKRILDGL